MATDQERSLAVLELESNRWTVRPADGGWVIEDDRSGRVFPPRASDPPVSDWVDCVNQAVAHYDAVQLTSRNRQARRIMDAVFGRGLHPRPKMVPGIDPETGQPIQIRKWDLYRPNGNRINDPRVSDHDEVIGLLRAADQALSEL